MRILTLLCVAVIAGISVVLAQPPAPTTNRLYIEERVKTTTGASVHCDTYGNCFGHNTSTTRNVSLDVTRDLMKTCRSVIVTDNRKMSDYVLRITPGSSTPYRKNGDVAYVSPARFKVSNLAKDVCRYIESHARQ